MTRRAVVTLAAVALGAGVFVSVSEARAAGKCNPHVCSEEISSACGAFTDAEFRACRKSVVGNCKTHPDCSRECSVSAPGGPTTTTTTTTSTTTTTTSSTTTTTVAV